MELTWLRADGKPQKGVPAAVRQEHAEDHAELKRDAKELEALLPAQRAFLLVADKKISDPMILTQIQQSAAPPERPR